MRAAVTGAASGLGLAIVRALVSRGADVVGIDLPGAERTAIVTAAGAHFVACDVTSLADWQAAAKTVGERLAELDLLALNAGVMTRRPTEPIDNDPLLLVGSDDYRRVFAVNVDGVAFGVASMRALLVRGSSIVVTASTAALEGLGFDPYYAASKHAVLGFVRSVAPALAHAGVRVNALCPGGIDTAIVPEPLRITVPSAAFRPPQDVARAALAVAERAESGQAWLLSDDADLIRRYETGTVR